MQFIERAFVQHEGDTHFLFLALSVNQLLEHINKSSKTGFGKQEYDRLC